MKRSIMKICATNHRFIYAMVIFFSFFTFKFSVFTSAQGTIKSEEVDIVKAYQPSLADAVKIQLQAQPADIDTSMQPLKYDVKQHVIALPFTPAEIKPVALPQEQQEPLQNNLIKAGIGTQLTPLFEVYLGNGRSEKADYGANFHFLSSHATGVDYQGVSHLGGKVFGTSYFKNTSLGGALSYDDDIYHFYGFDPIFSDSVSDLSKKLLKHHFQNLGVDLGFRNTKETKADIDYDFRFNYHDLKKTAGLSYIPSATEDYFRFDAALGKTIQKVHSAHFDFNFQREKFSSDLDTAINYFSILPNYQYRSDKLFIKGGLNLESINKEFKIYPVAEASYKLISDYLIPYIGLYGKNDLNTMKEITDVNPFVGYYSPVTSETWEGYLGLKGSYGNNISYNTRLSYRKQTNVPFYYSVGEEPVVFMANYYYQAMILGFYAEVGYKESERWNLRLSGEANSWDLDYDNQPIGIPKSKLTFSANYNIQEKIIFNVDLFGQTGAYAFSVDDSLITPMKGRIDLNLSATYNYKKNLAFWLSLNNITAAKQREWYNYPTYGFVALAGLMLKF